MEYITCAAIKWKHKQDPKGEFRFMEGPNHSSCFDAFSFMDIPLSDREIDKEVEGFMTTEDRFVDRYEALAIAKAANQLIGHYDKSYLESYAVHYYDYT